MESALKNACTLRLQNFEGPFDLLYHLIEKNQMSIYDIKINEIADQYMDYLYSMEDLDLEIASEFLIMASTLLHIKSGLLLPDKKEKKSDELDLKEDLVLKLIEYKKHKEFSIVLREKEAAWEKVFYKDSEFIEFTYEEELLDLNPDELKRVYQNLLERNEKKKNRNVSKMTTILQHEKVSLKSKIRDVLRALINSSIVRFSEIFSLKNKSKLEVVTGFMAILELTKIKKVEILQDKPFTEIILKRKNVLQQDLEDEGEASG